MSLHHSDLYTRASSQIAASSIFVANKIYEQMMILSSKKSDATPHLSEKFLLEALAARTGEAQPGEISKISQLVHVSKRLLHLAQNFEKELLGLKHLQNLYLPMLEEMVAKRTA